MDDQIAIAWSKIAGQADGENIAGYAFVDRLSLMAGRALRLQTGGQDL